METIVSIFLVSLFLSFSGFLSLPLFYKKNQLQHRADALKAAIHLASAMAWSRGESLVLRPLKNTKDWSLGMMLCVENKRGMPATPPIQEWRWADAGVTVSWHGFHSNEYLLFSNDLAHRNTNGYFMLSINNEHPLKLVLNRFGRIREEKCRVEKTHIVYKNTT